MRNPDARVSAPDQTVSCPGSPIHDILEGRFDGETFQLVKTGEENIQEKINAYAPFTDLNYMLHRLSVGDKSVLASRPAVYGDFSSMPSNPVDVINLVQSAESRFLQLESDERQKFGNDYRRWLAYLFTPAPAVVGDVSSGTDDSVKEGD